MRRVGRFALTAAACAAVAGVIIYAAWRFHGNFENQIVSQTQEHMLATARATAKGLEGELKECSRSLQVLASIPSVQKDAYERNNPCAQEEHYCTIESFYDTHEGHVDGLYFLDSDGVILDIHPMNVERHRVGSSLATKPGISYVLREHRPHVAEPFLTDAGNHSVGILEPVFYNNKFVGILSYLIHTKTLRETFIVPVKAGKEGYAWLIGDDGVILCHPESKYIGRQSMELIEKEFLDCARQQLINIFAKMLDGKEGTAIYYLGRQSEGLTEPARKLVAYAPVHVGDQMWSIGISMDYDEIAGPINRHARATFGLAGLLLLLFGTGGILLHRAQRQKSRLRIEAVHLKKIADGAEALRQKTHELEKSEQELAEILETSLDAITVTDSEGRIVRCNDALVKMHGYSSKSDLIGMVVLDLVAERDRARVKEGLKRVLTAPLKNVEYTCITRDGREFPTEVSASIIKGYPDELTYVVAVSKDVSERKDLEKALLEKEEAVLQETGLVLHESLAQTLAGAKMKSELAYGTLEKESPGAEHIREVTESIKQAIVDMRNMSTALFPLQLRHLGLAGALDQLAAEAGDRYGTDCRFECDEESVSVADNTALQFYRIAQQAIDNAGQHGNPDGRDDFKIRVGLASENGVITLSVRDNGAGFQGVPEHCMGTRHMSYRANTIGASFDIKSEKGKGTTATVSWAPGGGVVAGRFRSTAQGP